MIDIGVLGPLGVGADGTDVRITGRRERCVLAVLALHAGRVVSTTTLFDYLWGDDPPRTANKSLQSAVANLRRIMSDAATEGWLETSGPGYRLNVPHDRIDLFVFEGHLAAGRRALCAGASAHALQHLNDGARPVARRHAGRSRRRAGGGHRVESAGRAPPRCGRRSS